MSGRSEDEDDDGETERSRPLPIRGEGEEVDRTEGGVETETAGGGSTPSPSTRGGILSGEMTMVGMEPDPDAARGRGRERGALERRGIGGEKDGADEDYGSASRQRRALEKLDIDVDRGKVGDSDKGKETLSKFSDGRDEGDDARKVDGDDAVSSRRRRESADDADDVRGAAAEKGAALLPAGTSSLRCGPDGPSPDEGCVVAAEDEARPSPGSSRSQCRPGGPSSDDNVAAAEKDGPRRSPAGASPRSGRDGPAADGAGVVAVAECGARRTSGRATTSPRPGTAVHVRGRGAGRMPAWRRRVRRASSRLFLSVAGSGTGGRRSTAMASPSPSPQRDDIVVETAELAPGEESWGRRSLTPEDDVEAGEASAAAAVVRNLFVLRDSAGTSVVLEGVPVPTTREDRPRRKGYSWDHLSRRNRVISAVALTAGVVGVALAAVFVTRWASSLRSHAESPTEALVGQTSTTEALNDPTSPQRRALQWITEDDGLALSRNKEVAHLLQRYALAVFFYSTDGPTSWKDQFGFLSDEHECRWQEETENKSHRGVMCNDRSELVGIYLDNNNLTGTLPGPELAAFPRLSHLQLASNRLHGSIPDGLAVLGSLELLDLRQNVLNSTIPPSIGNLWMLRVLVLEENEMTGPIPLEIGNMSSLERIRISQNHFTSTIPSEWTSLTRLNEFHAADNYLSGSLPVLPFHHQNLKKLFLWKNRMTGTIPSSLGTLPKLKVLNLGGNQFHGPIPVSLANLTKLEFLSMFWNHLTGTIPPAILGVRKLQVLGLGSNDLTGSLPSNIGNPHGMRAFGVEQNWLTGTIPLTLGNLPSLVGLSLHSNLLTATIPSLLGEDAELVSLALENNLLTGAVPESLDKLEKMMWLSLARNNVTGSLGHICAMDVSLSRIITADCAPPDAEVSCDSCVHCCNDAVGECDHHFPIITYVENCVSDGSCGYFDPLDPWD